MKHFCHNYEKQEHLKTSDNTQAKHLLDSK